MNESEKILWEQMFRRLDSIEKKLDDVSNWKLKIMGGMSVIFAIMTYLGKLI